MKEHPILFSTPMIQAILEGRKTMTRRVVKFPKDYTGGEVYQNGQFGLKYESSEMGGTVQRLSPKWDIGDILWVREKWKKNDISMRWLYHYYAANDTFTNPDNKKWKPSIFMPKDACRIKLEISGIKVERLHDISGVDAVNEGCGKGIPTFELLHYGGYKKARQEFIELWKSINGPEAWNKNPWVWVIEFKNLAPE